MKVEGRCHCGRITYEAEVEPDTLGLCHCTDCQTLSGSPYRATIRTPAEKFVLRSGQPKLYVKTAESGTQRTQAFCPDCGTPLYAAAPTEPTVYSLRLGAIVQRAELRPRLQIWRRSALPWAMDLRGLAQRDRQ